MFVVVVLLLWRRFGRSDYREYFPGQIMRIRLNIDKNCRLLFDIFSNAIGNDSDSRRMANVQTSGEIRSEWRIILPHPPSPRPAD